MLGITDIALIGVDNTTPLVLLSAFGRLTELPGRCWLVGDGAFPQALLDALPDEELLDLDPLLTMPTGDHTKPDNTGCSEPYLPARLPRSDFPTFTADCRRLLCEGDADAALPRLQAHQTALAGT